MSSTFRDRQEILNEMAQIQSMERGKICCMSRKKVQEGKEVVVEYYNHQTWQDGQNVCRYVKADELQALKEAIAGRQRFEELADEFVEATVQMTRQKFKDDQEAKKNSGSSKRKSSGKQKRSSA
jgi:hypothetical protein